MKKLKILFITEKYPPIVCSGNRIYNISKELSKKHDVSVMCRGNNRWLFPMPEDKTIPEIESIEKIKFKVRDSLLLIPLIILFKLKIISNSKFYFRQTRKIINRDLDKFSKFDIVIASGPSWDVFRSAEYMHNKFRIPFILDYRDPWIPVNKKELDRQKKIINKAHRAITVTEDYAQQIKRINHYSKKVFVIENGVDLEEIKDIQPPKKKSNELRIGFAGNFVAYQNIDKLLYAISRLSGDIKKNVIFEGCGGPFQGKYESLSKKLGINSNYYGYLPSKKMNEILSSCDLFCNGNAYKNAVGGKFYTYLALNKPIIAYTAKDSQLNKEIKENSLGFSCFSVKELSETIKKIYLNKTILKRKDSKIKKYIQKYDWKVLAKKYDKLISRK